MKIKIIAVGKLKEKYWVEAVQEYSKRLGAYCDLEIVEIKEARLKGDGEALEEQVKAEEGRAILEMLNKKGSPFIITLEIKGKKLSSEALAEKLNALTLEGKSEIIFIIGGSLGISKEVSEASHLKLSFSDMTFPHQMMRVILLEQIYRGFKIIKGETYHK